MNLVHKAPFLWYNRLAADRVAYNSQRNPGKKSALFERGVCNEKIAGRDTDFMIPAMNLSSTL